MTNTNRTKTMADTMSKSLVKLWKVDAKAAAAVERALQEVATQMQRNEV